MAKLYFRYSAMNAGKTTNLLQTAYNYTERGMRSLILKPTVDDRDGNGGVIRSRIGLERDCTIFEKTKDIYDLIVNEHRQQALHCILVDEAQFLTKAQVEELCKVTIDLEIPVLCYGLRTDSNGELFEGSHYLLAWADKLEEIKTICHCGNKAARVLRIGDDGTVIRGGEQVCIGGNDRYVSVCRKHFESGEYQ